ncbi:MAG: hypothetical protein ABFD79_03820, partial [Phycisphaerales bacterium]
FSRLHPVNSQTTADITFDLKIVSDNNIISLNEKNMSYYKGKLENKGLLLPENVLDIAFDEKEAFGKYRIEAVFRENVSNRSYTAQAEVELAPFERPKPFESKEEFGNWVMDYFTRPDPVRAFAGILFEVQNDEKWIKENYPSLAFYQRIFTDNPFLWKYYAQLYKASSDEEKKKMLAAAGAIKSNEKEKLFVPIIEPSLMPIYKESTNIVIPDTQKITSGTQLDILWCEFFACGKYQPIRKIVSAFELRKYEEVLEKLEKKEIKETNDEIEKQMMLGAVYKSAIWSLSSNGEKYELVKQYCQTIYERERLTDDEKYSLAVVLKTIELKNKQKNQ